VVAFFVLAHPVKSYAPIVPDEPPLPPEVVDSHRITKVIAIKETGGTMDCTLKGLSGERGCHQFMPSTWRAYAMEVYGYVPEQTPEKAEYVTQQKVLKWLEEGYTPRDIFLTWNQGHRGGACKAGVNRYGVAYDSCAYAREALALYSND